MTASFDFPARTLSIAAVVASVVVPVVINSLELFVLEPLTVAPHLSEAYSQIGQFIFLPTLVAASVALLILLDLLDFAVLRLGARGHWRRDAPYSLWRTAKWCAVLTPLAFVLLPVSSMLLTMRITTLVYDDSVPPDSEMSFVESAVPLLLFATLLGGVILFVVSAIAGRIDREAAAVPGSTNGRAPLSLSRASTITLGFLVVCGLTSIGFAIAASTPLAPYFVTLGAALLVSAHIRFRHSVTHQSPTGIVHEQLP